MDGSWITILGVLGLFLLRLGVPLAITLIIGYWLRRLDDRWQAEAAQECERLAHFKTEEKQAMPPFNRY
jgi:hypothetical protein